MREILFRGMTEQGEWVYGVPLKTHYSHLVTIISEITDDSIDSFLVKPETVGQYTGLKDRDGVEIWEGDIVVAHEACARGDGGYDDLILQVVWRDDVAAFAVIENGLPEDWLYLDEYEHKVVGNIHQNPELLEES